VQILKEFRDFAIKGNALDLAVGVIIGAAFGKIVTSLVEDILMPPIGLLVGGVDFSDKKFVIQDAVPAVVANAEKGIAAAKAIPEVAIRYGNLITIGINFVIVAFCIFLVVKLFNEARKRFEAEKPAPPPAGPTNEEKLLAEIRDLLAKGR